LIVQVPADVRRLQHVLPTFDIGLAFEDKTFYRSVETTASVQQPTVYLSALLGISRQHEHGIEDHAVERRQIGQDLLQDKIAVRHGIFGRAQQVMQLAACRVVPNHQVLDMLGHPVTVDRPTEYVTAISLLVGLHQVTDGSL